MTNSNEMSFFVLVLFVCFELEVVFYSPFNIIKVMLSRSVNLPTLFLGRVSPLKWLTIIVHIVLPVTNNCLS